MFPGIYSFLPGCPICGHKIIQNSLLTVYIFVVSVLTYLSFHLFGPILFLCFLMSLAKCLSILFIFSSNDLLYSMICSGFYYFFQSLFNFFHSDLYNFLPATNFGLCLLCSPRPEKNN